MKTIDDSILDFLSLLASIRAGFRRIHIFSEECGLFRRVITTVNPFMVANADGYADGGVTIQFGLDAELLTPPNLERKALGASLLLRRKSGMWVLEAEIGWSGEQVGWDSIDSRDTTETTIEGVIQKMPELGEWLCARFKEEVGKLAK